MKHRDGIKRATQAEITACQAASGLIAIRSSFTLLQKDGQLHPGLPGAGGSKQ